MFTQQDIQRGYDATKDFINADVPKRVLALGLRQSVDKAAQLGIILHGPGGYGKSQMAYRFLESVTGQEPFVVSLHADTNFSNLFGGQNIPALMEARLEYNVEQSWINSEYVIFEEGLSAPKDILCALRDILTGRRFTEAGKSVPIKTRLVVICTNVSPEDFNTDASANAFLERFPYIQPVDWSHLTEDDEWRTSYRQLIDPLVGSIPDARLLTNVLVTIAHANKMSPRSIQNMTSSVVSEIEFGRDMVDAVKFCGKLAKVPVMADFKELAKQAEWADVQALWLPDFQARIAVVQDNIDETVLDSTSYRTFSAKIEELRDELSTYVSTNLKYHRINAFSVYLRDLDQMRTGLTNKFAGE